MIPDVVLLSVTLYFFRGDADLKVTMLGKTRTAALMIGTPMLLLAKALDSDFTFVLAWVFLGAGMVMHVIAFSQYLVAVLAKHRELHLPALQRQPPTRAAHDVACRGVRRGGGVLPRLWRTAPRQRRAKQHRWPCPGRRRFPAPAAQPPLGLWAGAAGRWAWP